jgi:heme/copper-type cytochrome/quinol oxidase subunit 3
MTSRHGHQHHHKSRLSRGQRIMTYAALCTAWLSGATWLLFHYFLQRQGEFGLEPNPLEHWWLRLHGLCAFALLSLSGLLWVAHARPGMRWPRRRRSGVAITISFCVLALSGYCLYYVDDGAFRDAAGVVHWIIGLSLAVPVALHALPQRRASIE